jgi:hypothetical protein
MGRRKSPRKSKKVCEIAAWRLIYGWHARSAILLQTNSELEADRNVWGPSESDSRDKTSRNYTGYSDYS